MARRSHRYAHHVRALPPALERLARDLRVPQNGRVLDYGSADAPYRRFFSERTEFVTADLPGNPHAAIELTHDGSVPVRDGGFDAVLSTQVLEHVQDPSHYLAECFRVLRPGGTMLLSTHGVFSYHPDPVDYWRWTSLGLRRIVTDAGFEIERFIGIIGLAATGIQLLQDSFIYGAPRRMQRMLALGMQSLASLVDRLEGERGRDANAQVFALIAART
jgi:SAM-dependent methyltransferase